MNSRGERFWSRLALAIAMTATLAPAAVAQQRGPMVQQAPDNPPREAVPGPAAVDIGAAVRRAQEAAAAGRSTEALDAIDEAAVAIWEKMPLTIRRATFVAEEPQGYGVFNARDSSVFEPAQPMLVYAELAGQGWRRSGDLFRTDLALDFELKARGGQPLVAQQTFNTVATASRRRNREFFVYVTYSFSGLEPGDYVVRTTIRDRVGAKQTSFDLSFTVRK